MHRAYSSAQRLDADVLLASINWDTYWLYLLTEAALSLSPGPAVMLVIAYGLTHGSRRSLFAALGLDSQRRGLRADQRAARAMCPARAGAQCGHQWLPGVA